MVRWPWDKPKSSPEAVVRGLRDQALQHQAAELGLAASPSLPHVFGVVMEIGYSEAVASLVAFAEGSTSLYFSNGGGIIGAGEHASVRATLPAFFAAAEAGRGACQPAIETPFPTRGRVRFYLRTFEGTLTAEADKEDLEHRRHELSPLFYAGQAIITAVREASPNQPPA